MPYENIPTPALEQSVKQLEALISQSNAERQNITDELSRRASESAATFRPEFRKALVKSSLGGEWELNSHYFATVETARWIAVKFGDGNVYERDSGSNGGMFSVAEKELHIRTAAGRLVNAGLLAAYYLRWPAPDAEREIKGVIERDGG